MMRMRTVLVAAGLLLLPCASSAQDLSSMTGCQSISGYEREQQLPPVVTYWEKGREEPQRIVATNDTKAKLKITAGVLERILAVDYSPFLHAYAAVDSKNMWGDEEVVVDLPRLPTKRPGDIILQRLTVTVSIRGQPLGGAIVMFQSGLFDGSPYAMEADRNGVIAINCFQYLTNARSVVVSYGNDEFEAALTTERRNYQEGWGRIEPLDSNFTLNSTQNSTPSSDQPMDTNPQ